MVTLYASTSEMTFFIRLSGEEGAVKVRLSLPLGVGISDDPACSSELGGVKDPEPPEPQWLASVVVSACDEFSESTAYPSVLKRASTAVSGIQAISASMILRNCSMHCNIGIPTR